MTNPSNPIKLSEHLLSFAQYKHRDRTHIPGTLRDSMYYSSEAFWHLKKQYFDLSYGVFFLRVYDKMDEFLPLLEREIILEEEAAQEEEEVEATFGID